MKKAYFLAFTLLAMPVMADNDRGFYVGVGASAVDDRQDTTVPEGSVPTDTKAIRLAEIIAGYKYNDALAAEVRVGSSVRAGKGIIFETKNQIERDLGNYQSFYYRPELVNDEAKLYALLGYTKISSSLITKDTTGKELSKASTSYSGFSYGIGIGFVINEHFNINFEYKNICEELYDSPNTSSLNIDYRF